MVTPTTKGKRRSKNAPGFVTGLILWWDELCELLGAQAKNLAFAVTPVKKCRFYMVKTVLRIYGDGAVYRRIGYKCDLGCTVDFESQTPKVDRENAKQLLAVLHEGVEHEMRP